MGASLHRVSSRKVWITSAGGVFAALALAGMAFSQEAPQKEEVFKLTTAIEVPNSGQGASTFFSFDISWFSPAAADVAPGLKKYFLADRNNKAIDVIDPTNNSITQFVNPGFAGLIGTNNDISGPDGVRVVNGTELWVGDSPGKVWVLNASNGTVKNIGVSNPILVKTTGNPPANATTTRADEFCWDQRNHVVMITSPAEDPPFVTFISTDTYKVLGHITFGQNDTLFATNGLEQCRWSPQTGKLYQNVPEVNGPGNDTKPGAVAVINAKTMKIETSFPVPFEACAGPQGMAMGPSNQIMLGCSAPSNPTAAVEEQHSNIAIINANSGAVMAVFPDIGGADEVWYNAADNHYYIPGCNAQCRAKPVGTEKEQLAIVDSRGFKLDQIMDIPSPAGATGRRIHSVAADPNSKQVYVPIPAIALSFSPSICSTAPTKVGAPSDAKGCIAVFAPTQGVDDRPRAILERPRDDHQE